MLDRFLRRGSNVQKSEVIAAQAPEQKLFDREQTSTVTIQTSKGAREALIKTFSALTGWEVKSYAKEFYSKDKEKFRAFTKVALSHASINGAALDSEEVQNDLLERWQNVEVVFNAVMAHNGIDMEPAFVMANEISTLGIQIGKSVLGWHAKILKADEEGGNE